MNALEIQTLYAKQKDYFASGITRSYTFRRKQLILLKSIIQQNENAILEALAKDMSKPHFESFISEIGFVYEEINVTLKHLKKWMRPEAVATPMPLQVSSSYIRKEPLGLTLIIGPWNYPFQLIIAPLIGAIAGGNCAILKPSEFTPYTSNLIEKLIKENFDDAYISVIQGDGKEIGEQLIVNYPFGLIFFTGSTKVGQEIQVLAAKQMSKLVLELGGKSPAIVDSNVQLDLCAKQLVWAKFFNAGQTCVSPDYILVHESVQNELKQKLIFYIQQFYGSNAATSNDYARIINTRQFDRLSSYLKDVNIIYGGGTNRDQKYIEPTLIEEIPLGHPVLTEEIFGPILPILVYKNQEDLLELMNKNPIPLSAYIFTNDSKFEKKILDSFLSGGVCINNLMVHLANPNLPFGGVGKSGMGAYHGKYSFDVFTHQRAVLKTSTWIDIPLRYPPFSSLKMKIAKWFFK